MIVVDYKLQWGRGISAAESAPLKVFGSSDSQLQWGRGISAAESKMWTGFLGS